MTIDVGLLLEGTYPYVRGGVSTWVHQLINAHPRLSFAIIFLGSRPQDYPQKYYEVPSNVKHLSEHYLFDTNIQSDHKPEKANPLAFQKIATLHEEFTHSHDLLSYFNKPDGISLQEFWHSRLSWDYICEKYQSNCTDPSFIDYFWTVRNMHLPLWTLAKAVESMPKVKLYHSISTGYAGLLGCFLKQNNPAPYIISEHGIYTKERRIDLIKSEWIKDNQHYLQKDVSEISYFRKLWISYFERLGQMAYAQANVITSLFSGYQQVQQEEGADGRRTHIIANGVDLKKLNPLIKLRKTDAKKKIVAFIGRIVPIKDLKTFIRAVSILHTNDETIEAWIIGPDDEDKAYCQDCHELVESLQISNVIQFLGMQDITEMLPQIDVMILSSISEGLPLVLLESFAAGVPAVATNVGACQELIEGVTDEDKALGRAGFIADIADPNAIARYTLQLLNDKDLWQACQQAAVARVKAYYDEHVIFKQFNSLYEQAQCVAPQDADSWRWQA